jgi:multidrug resistance efflux pump
VPAAYWLTSRPKAQRRPPERSAVLVTTHVAQRDSHQVSVSAMGTVMAARRVALSPEVTGRVTSLSPTLYPGGRLVEGVEAVALDPAEYRLSLDQARAVLAQREADLQQRRNDLEQGRNDLRLAELAVVRGGHSLIQQQAAVTRAETALAVEMGQQSISARQYELLGESLDEADLSLVLRKPQLRAASADVESARASAAIAETEVQIAEAKLEGARLDLASAEQAVRTAEATLAAAQAAVGQAELDLDRTRVKAPFNALVMSKGTDPGARVAAGAALAEIVGTDEYWVRLSVPVDQLGWIRVPGVNAETGSEVLIHARAPGAGERVRRGTVKSLVAELEPQGRMAQLIVSVPDPLDLLASGPRTPLILGSYVRAEIEGVTVDNVVELDRLLVRDGNRVWVMDDKGTLDIREVEVAWSDQERVLVTDGVDTGTVVVTSDLGSPVQGMALRTAEDSAGGKGVQSSGAKPGGGAGKRDRGQGSGTEE